MHNFFKLHVNGPVAAAFLFALPAAAQVGIGLSPLRVELPAVVGQTKTQSLSISNESPTSVHIRANTLDFRIDDEEQPQFSSTGLENSPHSCRKWLKLNPVEFDLAPNEHKTIRYSFRYPDQLDEGSFHCAASFTTSPQPGEGQIGMATNIRLITTFYAVNGRPKPSARVTSVRFAPPADNSVANRNAVLNIENTSSTYFRVNGTLEVRDASDSVIETAQFRAIPILPDRVQPFTFPLKTASAPGQTMRARIDIGDGEIQEINVRAAPGSPALQ